MINLITSNKPPVPGCYAGDATICSHRKNVKLGSKIFYCHFMGLQQRIRICGRPGAQDLDRSTISGGSSARDQTFCT